MKTPCRTGCVADEYWKADVTAALSTALTGGGATDGATGATGAAGATGATGATGGAAILVNLASQEYVCGECTRAPCPPPACTSAQTPYPTHTTHPRALPLLSDTNIARATCT